MCPGSDSGKILDEKVRQGSVSTQVIQRGEGCIVEIKGPKKGDFFGVPRLSLTTVNCVFGRCWKVVETKKMKYVLKRVVLTFCLKDVVLQRETYEMFELDRQNVVISYDNLHLWTTGVVCELFVSVGRLDSVTLSLSHTPSSRYVETSSYPEGLF